MATLALDFGTSNSAAAMMQGGEIRRIPIAGTEDTLPTAVFFPPEGEAMLIGHDAVSALIAGDEGRFMRALKSILGTSLFHDSRLIEGRRRTLASVVTAFLVQVKQRAEARAGVTFDRVLSGRPVHFHSADPARDAQAEEDLRACYLAAGFAEVAFMAEPEAAAWASHALHVEGGLGLIVDIGGGTSDFTLFRSAGGAVEILSSHGIRLGGTDFDQAVSMYHVMPLLGQGGELKRSMGDGLLPVPNAVYLELSTWAKIPFLYSRDTKRLVDDMLKHAVQPRRITRLQTVITHELGHALAFAVEKGKIAANNGASTAFVDMGMVEPRLVAPVDGETLGLSLAEQSGRLRDAIAETLTRANVTPDQVGSVILVGGSSLMGLVRDAARAVCPDAPQHLSEAFTAVVDGLALASA